MTWLIIAVVLAAAFAPVAYMMPSKRDRALNDLRMVARREGLDVDVTRLPKLAAEAHERVSAGGEAREAIIDCVSYGVRLNPRQAAPVRWRLLFAPDTEFPMPVAGAPKHWELDRSFKPATTPAPGPDYWQHLPVDMARLPADVLGLAVTDDYVLCYWLERLHGVEDRAALVVQIRESINLIAEYHSAYFAPEPPGSA